MSQDDAGAPDQDPSPNILLEAAPRYLIGFPLVVAVTYDNRSGEEDYFVLPDIRLLTVPWGIGFNLAPLAGGAPVEIRPSRSQDEFVHGVALKPGAMRRMLLDLSNFGVALPPGSSLGPSLLHPGTYRLTILFRNAGSKETTSSNPVTIELVAPTAEDAKEATRLRLLGLADGVDTGAWKPFLSDNWNTVVPAHSLSFDAQRQLALYLFLHRAFYGPDPVAKLDESLLTRITEPSLSAEVAAMRCEMLAARGAPTAKKAIEDLRARWPGMAYRLVPEKDALGGTIPLELAQARQMFGPEGDRLHAYGHVPYTK